MPYCDLYDRHFESTEAIRQHRQDSGRYTADLLSTRSSAAPIYLDILSWKTSFGFRDRIAGSLSLFGAQPAYDISGDKPSKDLISSLKGYNHFALIVSLSLEFIGINNGLRLGSTLAGST